MPSFSTASEKKLQSCDPRLQEIAYAVIQFFDFTVVYGERGSHEQNKLFMEGKSKLQYPESKHNTSPSLAFDLAPYPIDWNDFERFTYLAGCVQGTANALGYTLRWGGDWDQDTQVKDEKWRDYAHFEIVEDSL